MRRFGDGCEKGREIQREELYLEDETVLEEEINLLANFEAIKKYRIAQTSSTIDFPMDLLMNIADNISEIRRKVCFTKVESELTKYCLSLKKVETKVKHLLGEWNGTMEGLTLEMTMPEEVSGVIASNIGYLLDEKSTEDVLFRLKDVGERERSMR